MPIGTIGASYEQLPKLVANSFKIAFGGPIALQGFCTLLSSISGVSLLGGGLSLYWSFANVPEFYLCLLVAPTRF